jgi:hypothetical protein
MSAFQPIDIKPDVRAGGWLNGINNANFATYKTPTTTADKWQYYKRFCKLCKQREGLIDGSKIDDKKRTKKNKVRFKAALRRYKIDYYKRTPFNYTGLQNIQGYAAQIIWNSAVNQQTKPLKN